MTSENSHPDRMFNVVIAVILVLVLAIVGSVGLLMVNNLQAVSGQLVIMSESMATREEIKRIAKDVAPWNDDREEFHQRDIDHEKRLKRIEEHLGLKP